MKNKYIEPKQIWESMTLWVNSILLILPEFIWVLEEVLREELITVPSQVNVLIKIIALANIVLRLKTKQAIKLP